MSDRKLPYIPFYPQDWMNDSLLKLCTLEEQGFLMRLICVMHTCEPYGHLSFKAGIPATAREISKLTGVHTNGVTPLVTSLVSRGVLSKTPGGVLYSRRMVRDAEKRLINQQNGKLGGNPELAKTVNPPLKAKSVAVTDLHQKPPSPFSKAQEPKPNPTPPAKATDKKPKSGELWEISFETFSMAYNGRCPNLIQVKAPTKERLRLFREGWRERPSMEYWTDVMSKANRLPFARGINDRGQKYGIEFMLRHHVKIAEGYYVNHHGDAVSPLPARKYVEHRPPEDEIFDPSRDKPVDVSVV